MYRIYADRVSKKLNLGHRGENEARCVVFNLADYMEEFGTDGTWEIVFRRNIKDSTEAPYLVSNSYALDTYAVWVLTDVDTGVAGEGRCEVRYKVGDTLVKTDVYAATVLPSLGDTGETPTPSEDLIEKIAEIKDEAKAAATAAQASETATSESETNAAGSAAAAEDSAEKAGASATAAAGSASAAATSEKNAESSAFAASTSEKNTATSEANSKQYADAAAASEKAAAESETNAAASAKSASDASATVSEYEALWIGAENWRMLRMHGNDIDALKGLTIDVAMTNTLVYPHNNSQQTVSLSAYRNNKDYYVIPEVLSHSGAVGDIEITDKLVNGFKIAYTGAATTATIRCHVIGGM